MGKKHYSSKMVERVLRRLFGKPVRVVRFSSPCVQGKHGCIIAYRYWMVLIDGNYQTYDGKLKTIGDDSQIVRFDRLEDVLFFYGIVD